MPTTQWLTIARGDRKDAVLTIARSGELYGCNLNLYVKFLGAGPAVLIPDAQGNSKTDFMFSPDVRPVPAAKLAEADSVYIDVICTIDQPAKLSGTINFNATLAIAGQAPSMVDSQVTLSPGDEAEVMHVGWEIDNS